MVRSSWFRRKKWKWNLSLPVIQPHGEFKQDVRTIKESMETKKDKPETPVEKLTCFLLGDWTTLISATGSTPAELLMGEEFPFGWTCCIQIGRLERQRKPSWQTRQPVMFSDLEILSSRIRQSCNASNNHARFVWKTRQSTGISSQFKNGRYRVICKGLLKMIMLPLKFLYDNPTFPN